MEPVVIQVILSHKARLVSEEQAAMAEMAQRWLETEDALTGRIESLAEEVNRAGGVITPSKLARMERYLELLRQAREELAKYEDWVDGDITMRQAKLAVWGIEDGVQAVTALQGGFGAYFDRIPVRAVEGMVGLAGDGSPLKTYLAGIYPDAINGLTEALVRSMALGVHPIKLAREMVRGFGVGINRALNTARTETLRVYRQASLEQYRATGVVGGYMRMSARDSRVCAGCLGADDGTVHPLDEPFSEHNQGRCTTVPVLDGPLAGYETGEQWFMKQTPAVQGEILGKRTFEAWAAQKFEFKELVKHVDDPVWGGAYVPRPLKELI